MEPVSAHPMHLLTSWPKIWSPDDLLEPTSFGFFTLVCATSYFLLAVGETLGVLHIPYSKFSIGVRATVPISTRFSFFLVYFLPLVVSMYLNANVSNISMYHLILRGLGDLHYIKRCLEVLFLHSYSSSHLPATFLFMVGAGYCASMGVATWWCTRYISESMVSMLLVRFGTAIALTGELINLYHHVILANLRKNANPKVRYHVPRGGLFSLVCCPHYFGEQMAYLGMAIAAQHLGAWLSWAVIFVYLTGRARSTKAWYAEKRMKGPWSKAIVPFLV